VDKLLVAGFIKEVIYLVWPANVVMVKKNNGKWQKSVNFTDLNKAYLNNSYHLPKID
jgi:hypothetical protein